MFKDYYTHKAIGIFINPNQAGEGKPSPRRIHMLDMAYLFGGTLVMQLYSLKSLINKAVRIITFAPFGPLDLQPIYRELEFLNLHKTFLLEKGKFMYKRKKELLPTVIASYFDTEPAAVHTYNLRRRENSSYSFRSNSINGRKSIQNKGEILWQEMSQYLKDIDSLISFKNFYKAHLIGTDQ